MASRPLCMMSITRSWGTVLQKVICICTYLNKLYPDRPILSHQFKITNFQKFQITSKLLENENYFSLNQGDCREETRRAY
jgi:hypothetical protein